MSTVFPSAEPRQSNVTMVGQSASTGVILLIVLGLIFGGVGTALGLDGETGGMIFGGVLMLIGLLCVGGAVKKCLASMQLEPPSITISASPLYLGETLSGELVQRVKKTASINSVNVTLVCREWVEYTQGTSTHTQTHDVYTVKETLDVSGEISPPDCIRGHFEFEIPEEGMHTFSAPDNKVSWRIEVHTDVAGWPDYSSSFELSVAARIAPHREKL